MNTNQCLDFCLQDLLNKLKTAQEFDEDILVLDPDLIDLTIIPPPLTPDDVRVHTKEKKISATLHINLFSCRMAFIEPFKGCQELLALLQLRSPTESLLRLSSDFLKKILANGSNQEQPTSHNCKVRAFQTNIQTKYVH